MSFYEQSHACRWTQDFHSAGNNVSSWCNVSLHVAWLCTTRLAQNMYKSGVGQVRKLFTVLVCSASSVDWDELRYEIIRPYLLWPAGGGWGALGKWPTSAHLKNECRAFKISLKKGGSFGVGSKNRLSSIYFFDVGSQKWGSFSVQKCNFKPKFANLQISQFECKIWYQSEKRGHLGVDWRKKGESLGIDRRKKGSIDSLSLRHLIHRHIGVPPPPVPAGQFFRFIAMAKCSNDQRMSDISKWLSVCYCPPLITWPVGLSVLTDLVLGSPVLSMVKCQFWWKYKHDRCTD